MTRLRITILERPLQDGINASKMIKDKAPIYFIIVILLLLSLFSLVGCSSQWHVKRAIKKDPTILVKDTINHIDTFRVETNRVEIDSVFMVSSDTTVIIKENLTIRHFIHNDSVFITGECDTIFMDVVREVKVPFEKIVINNTLPKWVYYIFVGVGLLVFLIWYKK